MDKSSNRFLLVLAAGICICLAAMLLGSPLAAQSTFGSISGSVADASGAAVPDAQVTLTSTATSAKQTYTTGGDGLYSFVNLNPGDYRLDVEKAGFKHYKRESVFVQVQQSIRIDAIMEVGAVNQTVEVTAETPLLTPTDTSLGQVIDERATNEIPLNGRNVFNLITLSPAAIAQGGSGGSQVGQNPFSWGNYQVGGSFGNESAEYIDGQPINIGYINLPVLIPDQDAVAEFKVQYNNLGPEWGKFAGGIVNLSTKGGSNQYHGGVYEYLRNKVLNAYPYNFSPNPETKPPYVQNQFGGTFGGPVIKDKTFFFFAYDGYRQRASTPFTTTVPTVAERGGVFPAVASANGPAILIYDPLSVGAACLAPGGNTAANCGRTQFLNNTIPTISPAALEELKFIPMPTNSLQTGNFTSNAASGGNTNQYVARVDQNLTSNQHIFARYNFFNLLDLPTDPFGTGLCADRCAETYQTNAAAISYSYTIKPDLILNIIGSGSRFHYLRSPTNSGFDLTQYGWPTSYNTDIPSASRSPFTPCFSPEDPSVTCSQGQSFITDHDTQFDVSPSLTWIRGKHTFVFGGQLIETYDNYAQTNIASGAFAFDGSWTSNNAVSGGTGGISFADFLLGYGLNQSSVFNHNYGEAQVPGLVAQKETYRGFYFGDTWRVTPKLTINYGVRYDLPGGFSVRHDLSTYWDPAATNRTVTGCINGNGPCPGDVFFVKSGIDPGRSAIPLYKKEFMPRVGLAYSWDQKTVIRAGYGIFFIPNWTFFGLNPSNDGINTASTLWVASTNGGLTPNSTLTATNCVFAPEVLTCPTNGPFGPTINTPLNRSGNVSAFDAGQNITEAPYSSYRPGYVQQFNLDIQRQLPGGVFVDAAYAGSRGVHLPNPTATGVNQIPDSFISQAEQQSLAGLPVTIAQPIANPLQGITTVSGLNPTSNPTILAGQLDRPYPEYGNVSLAGDGCCGSNYNSFQLTATKRFKDGGTFLAAYTNAKLMSNADTLTTWLETGVGEPQDWNNLKAERSLSSQDVSQRLVISYVYDLPFGHGQRYMSDATGVMDKVVGGWGVDGVTTFQKGFPLPLTYGASTALSNAGFGIGPALRPDVIAGCAKSAPHVKTASGIQWINPNCFAPPGGTLAASAWAFGDESRVDATLRGAGINNWDFALFKTTNFGPENKLGLQFRTEFFNTFNRVQFGPPNTACCNNTNLAVPAVNNAGFGLVTSTLNSPRLIQFALKFMF
ncbi:MAG: TonB-dependent receptor [Candidatus Acidiferrales bacterium]|jgi:hypothetical protein